MRIAIYTLTRDRLEYTKHCFQQLKDRAGMEYDHYVVDNGSEDGTQDWLVENRADFRHLILNTKNEGISKASNQALEAIFSVHNQTENLNYDLVIKMDNDCEVLSPNMLGQVAEIYQDIKSRPFEAGYVLSPYVEGINRQPTRGGTTMKGGRQIGLTAIVGGLFHIVPGHIYKEYRYPEQLPKAWGQDDHFCDWVKKQGGQVGYIEGLKVNHYETTAGQAERFPEYFARKREEEKQ